MALTKREKNISFYSLVGGLVTGLVLMTGADFPGTDISYVQSAQVGGLKVMVVERCGLDRIMVEMEKDLAVPLSTYLAEIEDPAERGIQKIKIKKALGMYK